MTEEARKIWSEKLDFLLAAEAKLSDPSQLFTISVQIREARAKLAELHGLGDRLSAVVVSPSSGQPSTGGRNDDQGHASDAAPAGSPTGDEMSDGLAIQGESNAAIANKNETFVYSGDRLSLNFQDIEVRAILQLLADFTGLNLIASDTVCGRITLRLKNLPWDQALDIILKCKGLSMR